MRRKSIKGAHFFRDSCVLSFCGLKEKRVSFPLSRLREEYDKAMPMIAVAMNHIAS